MRLAYADAGPTELSEGRTLRRWRRGREVLAAARHAMRVLRRAGRWGRHGSLRYWCQSRCGCESSWSLSSAGTVAAPSAAAWVQGTTGRQRVHAGTRGNLLIAVLGLIWCMTVAMSVAWTWPLLRVPSVRTTTKRRSGPAVAATADTAAAAHPRSAVKTQYGLLLVLVVRLLLLLLRMLSSSIVRMRSLLLLQWLQPCTCTSRRRRRSRLVQRRPRCRIGACKEVIVDLQKTASLSSALISSACRCLLLPDRSASLHLISVWLLPPCGHIAERARIRRVEEDRPFTRLFPSELDPSCVVLKL